MELYLFRHPEWEELYRCSYDIDIIPIEKRVHEIHGILMIALSTIFLLIYIPTLSIIMCKFLDKSAYQIMFLIGVADVLILLTALIPCGISSLKGDVFCSQPTLTYVTGCLGSSFWVLSTESSAILALYRCLELWRPSVADALFKGRRTLLWIGFSLCHFTAVFFFGMPVIYSSIDGAFEYNPHHSYSEDAEGKFYNLHHRSYSIALFFVIIGLYTAFVYLMACKSRDHVISRQTLTAQYKALFQALIICTCEAISDAYWVFLLLGPTPPQIVIFFGMYTWICSHGVPGLIYISINYTVRDSVLKVLKIKKSVSPSRNAEPTVNPFVQLCNSVK